MDIPPRNYSAPFNSSDFDFSSGGDPMDTRTSINTGFAGFRWNLARNLLVFPAVSAVSSRITTESNIEAGYCIFYIDMQILSVRVQSSVYEERILDSTTRISDGESEDLTYTYLPDCRAPIPPTGCATSHAYKPINITIPRLRYISIMAALSKALPGADLTTSRQSGLYASGYINPEAAEVLYRSHNITKTMHTIAHYVTVALRANDTILERQNDTNNSTHLPADYVAPSHRVAGTVYVQTVLLHVRWGWLAFPGVLLLIVAGLLFETIRTSQREALGVWKNNVLAVLLNTQWKPETDMMGATTSKQLEKIAEGLEARVIQGTGFADPERSVVIRRRHAN
jgi:hypothetical protein